MNARNRARRRKGRARRTRWHRAFFVPLEGIAIRRDAFAMAMTPLTAGELWNSVEPADDDPNVILGALKAVGEPFTIQFHPLAIQLIDGVKRYELDGFYYRPLTVSEIFDRQARGTPEAWFRCRMIGDEPCIICGVVPKN